MLATPATNGLAAGASSGAVKVLQRRLARAGVYRAGRLTGVFDAETKDGAARFNAKFAVRDMNGDGSLVDEATHYLRAVVGGEWTATETLAVNVAGEPAVASWRADRLDVVWRTVDGALAHRPYDTAWGPVQPLGGALNGDPAIISLRAGHLDVYARNAGATISHKSYDDGWSPMFEELGGNGAGDLAVMSPGPDRIDALARFPDGTLQINSLQR